MGFMTIGPPARRTVKALERHHVLVERFIAEGMDRETAIERAYVEMRDNGKGDWRRG